MFHTHTRKPADMGLHPGQHAESTDGTYCGTIRRITETQVVLQRFGGRGAVALPASHVRPIITPMTGAAR